LLSLFQKTRWHEHHGVDIIRVQLRRHEAPIHKQPQRAHRPTKPDPAPQP
jgi:hypothetical protein